MQQHWPECIQLRTQIMFLHQRIDPGPSLFAGLAQCEVFLHAEMWRLTFQRSDDNEMLPLEHQMANQGASVPTEEPWPDRGPVCSLLTSELDDFAWEQPPIQLPMPRLLSF